MNDATPRGAFNEAAPTGAAAPTGEQDALRTQIVEAVADECAAYLDAYLDGAATGDDTCTGTHGERAADRILGLLRSPVSTGEQDALRERVIGFLRAHWARASEIRPSLVRRAWLERDADDLLALLRSPVQPDAAWLAEYRARRLHLMGARFDEARAVGAGTYTSDLTTKTAAAERALDEWVEGRAVQADEPRADDGELEDFHQTALEVLCRVFDDGADVGMQEWLDWYKPEEWIHPSRALGAFIRTRHQRAVPQSAPAQPATSWVCPECGALLGRAMQFCEGYELDPQDGGDTRHERVYAPWATPEPRAPEARPQEVQACGHGMDVRLSWGGCAQCAAAAVKASTPVLPQWDEYERLLGDYADALVRHVGWPTTRVRLDALDACVREVMEENARLRAAPGKHQLVEGRIEDAYLAACNREAAALARIAELEAALGRLHRHTANLREGRDRNYTDHACADCLDLCGYGPGDRDLEKAGFYCAYHTATRLLTGGAAQKGRDG